ncbi:MAG TPA: site-specific integrase [Rhodospirillaceae bacterium]|nr:site-specific integrase [Rhodospirillaceae bacterium]
MASVRKRTWTSGGKERTAWVVDYFDQHGKRHLKTCRTKKEADGYLISSGHEVKQGTHTADSTSVTVFDAGRLWLDRCRKGSAEQDPLERSTVREYERYVEEYINHAEWGIGPVKLSRLDSTAVSDFLDRLMKVGGKSKAMARKVKAALSALLSDANERKLVSRHVIREASVKRTRRKSREKTKVEIPTKDELRAMLELVDDSFRSFLITAVFTGLRASELRGLTWDNVNFEAGTITVSQRADRWNDIGDPKSSSGHRTIPMTPMVRNALQEWLKRQIERATIRRQAELDRSFKNGAEPPAEKPPTKLVFANGAGNVESLGNIYRRQFAPLQIQAGCIEPSGRTEKDGRPIMRAKYGLHALRHAAASLFIEQGFTAKKVQTLMGHSSIQMTFDTYGHLFPSPDDDQRQMAMMQARLVG